MSKHKLSEQTKAELELIELNRQKLLRIWRDLREKQEKGAWTDQDAQALRRKIEERNRLWFNAPTAVLIVGCSCFGVGRIKEAEEMVRRASTLWSKNCALSNEGKKELNESLNRCRREIESSKCGGKRTASTEDRNRTRAFGDAAGVIVNS